MWDATDHKRLTTAPDSYSVATKELEEAVGCLMRFLEEKRIWVEQDMRKAESSVSLEQDEKIQNALKMLDIVDTALLKSYMVAGGPQVGALLRNVNYCNLEETESLLIKHKVCDRIFPSSQPWLVLNDSTIANISFMYSL